MRNLSLGQRIFAFAYLVTTLGIANAQPVLQQNSYELASKELDRYCLERLCLGMTPTKVSSFGSLKWMSPPAGKLICDKGPTISAIGELTTADGKLFTLRFEVVNPNLPYEARYRLLDVQLHLNDITLLQADSLVNTLKLRYGPMRDVPVIGKGPIALFSADTNSGLFNVTVMRIWDPRVTNKLGLAATYKQLSSWLLIMPDCTKDLPKV